MEASNRGNENNFRNMKIDCPICNGSGKIDEPKNLPADLFSQRVAIAKKLREQKFSIREIMRIMNYKSPQSVSLLLNKTL